MASVLAWVVVVDGMTAQAIMVVAREWARVLAQE
jgi:hypothetical protein